MLTQRFPYPANRGDRIRSYNLLRELSRVFDVSLAAMVDEPISDQELLHVQTICDQVVVDRMGGRLRKAAKSALLRKSVSETVFSSKHLLNQIVRIHKADPFDSVLVFCSSMFPYVDRPEFNNATVVVDLVDVDSRKWEQLGQESGFAKRLVFARESEKVRRLEQRIVNSAAAVTLVSQAETDLLGKLINIPATQTLAAIGNGVDTQYFKPATVSELGSTKKAEANVHPASQDKLRLVFTGVMNYSPNVTGVEWFCQQVLPKLRSQLDVELKIVGRFPNSRVLDLNDLPEVEVVGSVPDMRPFLAEADVAISPLKLARGIQNKVLEAMAMGTPVVCTPQSAVGIDCDDGKHVLIADSVDHWCSALETLAKDKEFGESLAFNARRLVLDEYSWSAKTKPMLELLSQGLGQCKTGETGLCSTGSVSGVASTAVRVGFVMHKMQVAGAEVLVKQIIEGLDERIDATVFCLDGIGKLGHQLIDAGVPVVDLKRQPGIECNRDLADIKKSLRYR